MEGLLVELEPLAVQDRGTDPAQVARHARKLGPQERGIESHRLHELGPAVGGGGGDPDHRHRLHEAAAKALEVRRLVLGGGLDSEPGADRVRAHGDEQRAVVHVPDPEVGNEADLVPEARLDDGVVEPGHEPEAGEGCLVRVHEPVGEDEHGRVAGARERRLHRRREGTLQALRPLRGAEGRVEHAHPFLPAEPAQLARGEQALGEDVERALALVPQPRAVAERDRRLEDPGVPDGVDGWRGLLGEAQLEVVVEAARMDVEERGGRRVVAHRPDRELPGLDERREHDVLVFPGHAEGHLQSAELGGRLDRAPAGLALHPAHRHGEPLAGHVPAHVLGQQYLAGGEPDDRGVARSEDPLHLDLAQVDRARQLARGQGVVAGRRDPERAQAVAIEVGHRLVAVAGHDGGGTVAGPEQHAHRLVERGERGLALEEGRGLGQEGEEGLREGEPSGHERDQHVVQVRAVGSAGADDGADARRDPAQARVAVHDLPHQVLADRVHPGHVAADGRDLPVVGQAPERLGAPPGGGGVRGVAAVEEHEARGAVLVPQVGIELGDPRELGEAAVDDGAVGKARDREVVAPGLAQGLVEGEAQQVAAGEPAVLADAGGPAEESLAHHGRGAAGGGAGRQSFHVEGHVRPAQHVRPRLGGQLFDRLHALPALGVVEGQHEHPERHVALGDRPRVVGEAVEEEGPGDVEEQAGPVPRGAAVVELLAEAQGHAHHGALRHPLAGGEEAYAAGGRFGLAPAPAPGRRNHGWPSSLGAAWVQEN